MSKVWILLIITYSLLLPLLWIYKQYPYSNGRVKVKAINSTSDINELISVCKHIKSNFQNCGEILSADQRSKIHHAMDKNNSVCSFENILNNCAAFRIVHRYIPSPLSDEERKFPLAFSIKMHKNPEQAEQLLRTIYMPQNYYCIYVDEKAEEYVFRTMNRIGRCFKNIHVVQSRDQIAYSSIDLLKADLVCMEHHLKRNKSWKYHINLAGQEFPLKTNLEIVRILRSLNGVNDIESYDYPKGHDMRYRFVWERGDNIMEVTTKKKSPFRYQMDMSKGSGYPLLSYEFVKFILEDDVASQFLQWLNDTYAPEETFFATLNTLPWAPGGYRVEVRHNFGTYLSRAVIWTGDSVTCHGKMVRYVCVYGVDDLPWLRTRPQIIANKFDIEFDKVALDCLEEIIRRRTENPQINKLDWHYYRNLPHVKYYSALPKELKNDKYLQMKKKIWLYQQTLEKTTKNMLNEQKFNVSLDLMNNLKTDVT